MIPRAIPGPAARRPFQNVKVTFNDDLVRRPPIFDAFHENLPGKLILKTDFISAIAFRVRFQAQVKTGGRVDFLGRWPTKKQAQTAVARFHAQGATPVELRAAARMLSRGKRFLGVRRSRDRWAAVIRGAAGPLRLGTFTSAEDAAVAYDRVARHLGHRALNFPRRRLSPVSAAEFRIEYAAAHKRRSRFVGVMPDRDRWAARIDHAGQRIRLGRFDSEAEAAHAYDRAAARLHGRRALLNFHPKTGAELRGVRAKYVR